MSRSRRQFIHASMAAIGAASVPLHAQQAGPAGPALPAFRDLFNGRDLSGWVIPSGSETTWSVRDRVLVCAGKPNGVMRTDKEYENFVLQIDWRHMEPGGNSGLYVWSSAELSPRGLPRGIEIQILELDWVKLNTKEGSAPPPVAYVHGELIGVNGLKFVPDNPRGERSMSIENRAQGRGQWNTYTVVAVDGVVKLAVNGVFVNGISRATQKKGYLGLQSEGAEIHFRNISIMELFPGVAAPAPAADAR
jgi:3-keto-disaccharide hydrolase